MGIASINYNKRICIVNLFTVLTGLGIMNATLYFIYEKVYGDFKTGFINSFIMDGAVLSLFGIIILITGLLIIR